MSTSDSSEDLSDWSADDSDDIKKTNQEYDILNDWYQQTTTMLGCKVKENERLESEYMEQGRKMKTIEEELLQVKLANEASGKTLNDKDEEIKKKNDEIQKLSKENEMCKAKAQQQLDNRDEEVFIIFCVLALGFIAGYGLSVIVSARITSSHAGASSALHPWMKAELDGLNKTYWKMENTTIQLFERIMELDKIVDRQNVTKKMNNLENVHWNVSRNLQECFARNIKTVEVHLYEDLAKNDTLAEKEDAVKEEKKENKAAKEERAFLNDIYENLTEQQTRFMESIEGAHNIEWSSYDRNRPRIIEIKKVIEGFYHERCVFSSGKETNELWRPDNITRNGLRRYIQGPALLVFNSTSHLLYRQYNSKPFLVWQLRST